MYVPSLLVQYLNEWLNVGVLNLNVGNGHNCSNAMSTLPIINLMLRSEHIKNEWVYKTIECERHQRCSSYGG